MIPWQWVQSSPVPYAEAWEWQRARRDAVIEGTGTELLMLLEHKAVVTFGRREAPGNPSDAALRALGLDVFHTERGGLATWHGPGQLVGYLILHAGARGLGVKDVVAGLEDGLIAWLAGQGIEAGRREGLPGVWVGRDKIAAVGMSFRQGVSMHGFALNLRTGPEAFNMITPCGIADGGVTSLHRLCAQAPSPEQAAPTVALAVLGALERRARVGRRLTTAGHSDRSLGAGDFSDPEGA